MRQPSQSWQTGYEWLLTGQEGGEREVIEKTVERISEYVRTHELARIGILKAMKKNEAVWFRIEKVIREYED